MKNVKNILGVFTLFVLGLLLIPINTFATTEADVDDIMKIVSPDLENATFYMKEPTTMEEAEFGVTAYLGRLIEGDDYSIYGSYDMNSGICNVSFQTEDYNPMNNTGWRKAYDIHVTFEEPDENITVNSYINQLVDFDPSDPTTYYVIEDLSLINYYMTSSKSELWNPGAPGRALKYSTLNNTTKGSNITYYMFVGAGNQDETLMFESAFGPMGIFYNESLHGLKEAGIYLKRVIYIPSTTDDDPDAYALAAQTRINEYLGSDSVIVTLGGTLASLVDAEDPDYPIAGHDGNYYNVTVGTKTYKFYIVKGTDAQLAKPTYLGSDIDSKIEITSDDSSIPLDTSLTVQNVNDASIKDKIGTENYTSYDIVLYSSAKNAPIETLTNGKFLVKVPIPEELKGKSLVVYYITTTGEVEEHPITPVDGEDFVTFETDHFSVYTLAETTTDSTTAPETINPPTGDNIRLYVSIFAVSFVGLISIGYVTFRKKKETRR